MSRHYLVAEAQAVLSWAIRRFGRRFAVVTALQREGVVIIDIARKIDPDVRVLLIDTGRLPEESFEIAETVWLELGVKIEMVMPDPRQVTGMVTMHGPNLFRRDYALRELCCHVRKVEPLRAAMARLELDAWATGLRRDTGGSRRQIATVQHDQLYLGKLKVCPLAAWPAAAVRDYVSANRLPVHPLYDHGYLSIGCAPCTRPVAPEEGERAGRWWWEAEPGGECGIHGGTREERAAREFGRWREEVGRHAAATVGSRRDGGEAP